MALFTKFKGAKGPILSVRTGPDGNLTRPNGGRLGQLISFRMFVSQFSIGQFCADQLLPASIAYTR
jgi:hypothetical protein